MSNFTFYHNVFYAICILKSFNSHITVVVCCFFEFGMVSEWCIMGWVNFVQHTPDFEGPQERETVENIVGKGKNSGDQEWNNMYISQSLDC